MNPRKLGQLIGLVILAATAGIVIYGLSSRSGSTTSGGGSTPTLDAPPVTGRSELPGDGSAVQDIVALAEDAAWTRIDPETGELRYKLAWDQMEPHDEGFIYIDTPKAWMIDEDRVLIATSAVGKVVWPTRDREPESGDLEGRVILRVFDQVWENAAESLLPPEGVEPSLTVETNSLRFNTIFGEVTTDDQFTIVGDGIDASGVGLSLRFSTEQGAPITYLDIGSNVNVTLTETALDEDEQSEESSGGGEGSAGAESMPQVAIYRARFEGGVLLRTGDQTLSSESAEIWARLVDGRFIPGAIATWDQDEPASDAATSAAPASTGSPASSDEPRSVTVTCRGSVRVRLIPDAPEELAEDDVFARLQSPSGDVVRFSDSSTKASVSCMSLEYGATRRNVTLQGIGREGVTVRVDDLIQVVAGRIDLDLTTGIGHIPTAGGATELRSASRANDPLIELGDPARELSWSEKTDFVLDVSRGPVGSHGRVIPQKVILSGRVEARDGDSSVSGSAVQLDFRELDEQTTTLARIVVMERAVAQESRGGRVVSDELEVIFEPDEDTGEPEPVLATARGNVRANRGEQYLRAGLVEVELGQSDADEQIGVDAFDARLGVEISLTEAPPKAEPGEPMLAPALVTVFGDRVQSVRETGIIDIVGEPARLSRKFGDESSAVEGPAIQIRHGETEPAIEVFGAGTAEHGFRRPKQSGYGQVVLTFSEGITYDDRTLEGAAYGDVVTTADFGEVERHIGRGHTTRITLARNAAQERELARAVIEGDEQSRAELELRRYAGPPDAQGAQALESMAFLRGEVIGIDAAQGMLNVPTPGLLLIEDRRESESSGIGGPTARGTTLFEWQDELQLSRTQGRGTIRGRAQLRHRQSDDQVLTEIESERMAVEFDWPERTDDDQRLTLRSAEASGAVYVRREPVQIVCDLLRHDAGTGHIKAIALEGNRIMLFDEIESRHVYADAIELDVKTGTWGRITRPTGTLIPR